MRLFFTLFSFRKRMPNGHIFRGKDRLVKPVTPGELCKLKTDLEIQEKNMFYLRHAYLTPEQSCGHARALGKREQKFLKLICVDRRREFYDNVTLESRLGHLRYKEAWD